MTQTTTATKAVKAAAKTTQKIAAIKIFNRVMSSKNATRANVIKQLTEKLGLTPGGASTYYANMKNGKEGKAGGWSLDVSAVKAKPAVKATAKADKPVKVAKAA